MYPGEGMYVDDEPVHRHHLPKMDDDDDEDDNDHHHHHHDHDHEHEHNPYSGNQHHNHPPRNTPPPPCPPRHHPTPPKRTRTLTPIATPQLRPQQPLQPPTPLNPSQTLQPPTPLHPPVPLQPPTPQPPQPPLQFQPTPQLHQQRPPPDSPPTPRKPHPPPPMDLNHPHHYNDDDDEDKNPQRQLGAIVFILLLLFGLTALILWLIYRPTKPQFTAVATLIYSLNTTAAATIAPATVAASMQFVIHTRNPNKRTTLTYDHLAATVYYRTAAITPPVALPPLYHRKKSSIIIAPVIGGPPPAVAIPVAAEVAEEIAANEAYGVIGFSWVVVGRVRYRVGGFKSGHSRVYVRCDVVVRLNGVNNGVYINPGGQVPLLAAPPCLVDI